MGLTKRKDSYYVQFPVMDDGTMLKLARGVPGAKLKRWKVGCRNKEEAQLQEAIIKRKLLEGLRDAPDTGLPPLSFRDYIERWLVTAKTQLAARTLRGYQQVL